MRYLVTASSVPVSSVYITRPPALSRRVVRPSFGAILSLARTLAFLPPPTSNDEGNVHRRACDQVGIASLLDCDAMGPVVAATGCRSSRRSAPGTIRAYNTRIVEQIMQILANYKGIL